MGWHAHRQGGGDGTGATARSGATALRIGSFSDAAAGSGAFLPSSCSIAPEGVSREPILPNGSTQQERKLNTIYAISCAHKIGCTVFATWEDLVEVRASSQHRRHKPLLLFDRSS